MIETTKKPYEMLIRWDEDGILKAGHAGFAVVSKENGVRIAWVPLPVMPIAIGLSQGYPLKDILEQLHIDALIAHEIAMTDADLARGERDAEIARTDIANGIADAAKNSLAAAEVERDAAKTERDAAKTELLAAQETIKNLSKKL